MSSQENQGSSSKDLLEFDPNSPAGAKVLSAFLSISLSAIFCPETDLESSSSSSSSAYSPLGDNVANASVISAALLSLRLIKPSDLMQAIKQALLAKGLSEVLAETLAITLVKDCISRHEEIVQGLAETALKVQASKSAPGYTS